MIIKAHDDEANLLKRRLEFLSILDRFVYSGMGLEEIENDDQFKLIEREFTDVAGPVELLRQLSRIYPELQNASQMPSLEMH